MSERRVKTNIQLARASCGFGLVPGITLAEVECTLCHNKIAKDAEIIRVVWHIQKKSLSGGGLTTIDESGGNFCSGCWKKIPDLLASGLREAGKDVDRSMVQGALDNVLSAKRTATSMFSEFSDTTVH